MKPVLVIIVTYNGKRWLERCVGSVCADADLFVFDNDSTDGSADFVASACPGAKRVRSAENLGFSRPNNLGMRFALEKGYEYVYLLNQDAWLAPGALETLLAAAEKHPDYAVLSPLQYQDGYNQLDGQFEKCLPSRKGEKAAGECAGTETPVLSVKRVMAAHWLVRVAALREIGLFEEGLFPFYGQDDDWCQRARYHGWKIGVVTAAQAVHDRAQRQEEKEKVIHRNYYVGSLVRLCDINRPLWERFVFVLLFTLVKAVKYGSFLTFKYFRQICRQLPAVREHRRLSR